MISFLIHPILRDAKHKDHRKAIVVAWFLFLILISVALYDIYFFFNYPKDTLKQITNLLGLFVFVSCVLLLRFSSKIKPPLIVLSVTSLPATMVSVYHTGGIYSADISWLLLTAMGAFIIINIWWGMVSAAIVLLYLAFLFYADYTSVTEPSVFKEYVLSHNNAHYAFTWFFVLVLMGVLLGTFTLILNKTNKKVEELTKDRISELEQTIKSTTEQISALRSNIAKDFHDEMGNKLASINILSQSVALKLKNNASSEEIDQLLNTIELRSGELYQGTKDFIWSIDFKSDYINELFIYIRDFGENFFHQLDISYHSEKDFFQDSLSRLDASSIRQVIFVCKEIMTNAAKHSFCSEVVLKMKETSDTLQIIISDNGLGFDMNKVNRRGINNILNRTQAIKGRCTVESSNKGTVYTLEIPLNLAHLSVLDR